MQYYTKLVISLQDYYNITCYVGHNETARYNRAYKMI